VTDAELKEIRETFGLSASAMRRALGYSGPNANIAAHIRRWSARPGQFHYRSPDLRSRSGTTASPRNGTHERETALRVRWVSDVVFAILRADAPMLLAAECLT
jgi:hypothetical protein